MSWPDIVFSEEDKNQFQMIAFALERRIAADSNKFKDLGIFSQYPPFVDALRLAKEKKIDKPFVVPNMNYWYFETNLQEWSNLEGLELLSKFMLAIKGFPYNKIDEDGVVDGS
ncbi:hypothetical protein [Paucibacter sp. KCTC 42545]|uniref:hypothetical protein n=1 Tax=Paucibacter sp. KCTC 42545 TaxID=1768242 RepID=UPI000733A9E4|nr:hypothetical protein [Paucibacter sp. KCTC 42545]ALT79059.1 hypothetical protein AT984_19560 [Paucibacter sp. KCTC 42545]